MNLLAERWPGLADLPYVSLADLPTPLAAAGSLADGFDLAALSVKRDDLTSATYGGNKVRKLEFVLADALGHDAKAVITFGAYGSNHALATAVHATALGLEPHIVLTPQEPTTYAAATLLAHAGVGSMLHCATSGRDALRVAARVRSELTERDGIEPYIIPMGGSSPLGATGYVNAAFEIAEQTPGRHIVYVAGGTLGTAAGIAIGAALLGEGTRVEAVRATPTGIANEGVARGLVEETIALLRSYDAGFPELTFDDVDLALRDDQYGEDYAVATPAANEAVALASTAGFKLETTYSGKALAGLIDDARGGRLQGENVVFWDTYNSGPMPAPGDAAKLPAELREYLATCEALGS